MKRLCVFCGSSPGARAIYLESAKQVGSLIAQQGIDLVYGGASIGIMGAIADSVLEHGGKVYGVIPQHLSEYEISHQNLTELILTDTMHERKARMAEMSDGFLALPGGIGTLEELIEVCTWQQLQLHTKATGLLNIEGYYDQLLSFLDHAAGEQFMRPQHRNNILHSASIEQLLEKMIHFNEQPDHYLSEKLGSTIVRNN